MERIDWSETGLHVTSLHCDFMDDVNADFDPGHGNGVIDLYQPVVQGDLYDFLASTIGAESSIDGFRDQLFTW